MIPFVGAGKIKLTPPLGADVQQALVNRPGGAMEDKKRKKKKNDVKQKLQKGDYDNL